ncbi:MAG: hypothetical protein AMS18_14975, partial [Gemmatimonas sp. SG8_17]
MPADINRNSGAFPLILLAAACAGGGDGGAGGRWQAVVDTVGDTVVVRTVSGSVWSDTASLEAEISIGVFDGPDEYLIGDPRAITVGLDAG